MGVFLTDGLLQFIAKGEASVSKFSKLFFKQMGPGTVAGFAFGKALVYLVNRLRFPSDSIAAVFTMAFVALAFSFTDRLGGCGVFRLMSQAYLLGIAISNTRKA